MGQFKSWFPELSPGLFSVVIQWCGVFERLIVTKEVHVDHTVKHKPITVHFDLITVQNDQKWHFRKSVFSRFMSAQACLHLRKTS